jgi:hypothetical protein
MTQAKIEAPPNVYQCIAAVQGELAKTGIGKDSLNSFDKYKFRGIDAVYNALAPLLAGHGLCVLPRIIERTCEERESRKGDPMFYVTVTAEFDFVSAADGSTHTVRTYGEAMDRSDKATNKAMSAAYKYAAFMTFAIPTEGDNDADAATPEVAAKTQPEPTANARKEYPFPDGPATGITQLKAMARALWREVEGCGDESELLPLIEAAENKAIIDQLERLQDPEHRKIWEGDGGDNPGLAGHIQRKRAMFMAEYARA